MREKGRVQRYFTKERESARFGGGGVDVQGRRWTYVRSDGDVGASEF